MTVKYYDPNVGKMCDFTLRWYLSVAVIKHLDLELIKLYILALTSGIGNLSLLRYLHL